MDLGLRPSGSEKPAEINKKSIQYKDAEPIPATSIQHDLIKNALGLLIKSLSEEAHKK